MAAGLNPKNLLSGPAAEPVPAHTIDKLVDGVYPAMALLAGMELDLFSVIANGATSCSEIASTAGTHPGKTQLLLDALVAADLLTKDKGRYDVTPETRDHLTRTSPWTRTDGHHVLATLWSAAIHTAATVRSGRPAAPRHDRSAGEDEQFLAGLRGEAAKLAGQLAYRIGIRARDRVLDVGGGAGGAACVFADAAPDVRVTLLELPAIVPTAQKLIADAGYSARVRVLAADATRAVPGTYDIAWASFVTQTLAAADAESLIANTAASLAPDGRLHLINIVVNPSRSHPPRAALFNIALLNLYNGGQAHTTAAYERWLRSAGLGDITWHPLNDMTALVSARRHRYIHP